MKSKLILFALFLGFCPLLKAQDLSLFKERYYISKQDTLPFRILMPKGFDPDRKYPLVVFLHGSGERGSDNQLQLTHGARFFLQDSIRDRYPAIVVFPQCPQERSWNNVITEYGSDGSRVIRHPKDRKPNKQLALVEDLIFELDWTYPVDDDRIYVGGLSMGGRGTFEIVRRNPKKFAAAFAICGGAHPDTAASLKDTPFWIFHGEEDDVVPIQGSLDVYDALKEREAVVRLTTYPGVKHDSWTNTFAEPGLMEWLFSFER